MTTTSAALKCCNVPSNRWLTFFRNVRDCRGSESPTCCKTKRGYPPRKPSNFDSPPKLSQARLASQHRRPILASTGTQRSSVASVNCKAKLACKSHRFRRGAKLGGGIQRCSPRSLPISTNDIESRDDEKGRGKFSHARIFRTCATTSKVETMRRDEGVN